MRQTDDVTAVGVHYINVNVEARALATAEDDLRTVGRVDWIKIVLAAPCQAGLICAVRVHYINVAIIRTVVSRTIKYYFRAVRRPIGSLVIKCSVAG